MVVGANTIIDILSTPGHVVHDALTFVSGRSDHPGALHDIVEHGIAPLDVAAGARSQTAAGTRALGPMTDDDRARALRWFTAGTHAARTSAEELNRAT